MKNILLFILALPCLLSAQVREYEGEKFLEFTTQFPYDSTTLTGLDWKREKPEATFTLQGKNLLTYSVKPVNDSIMELWQLKGSTWKLQEKISYFGWALHRWDDAEGKIISELKITDFDRDGDEDLVCWVTSNANGNVWTVIFINDTGKQKLVKLISKADHNSDIWDAPTFDPATSLIHTELFSGAYGTQNTAIYRLSGTTTEPVIKEETDLSDHDSIVHTIYIGKKGMWQQAEQTVDGGPNGYLVLEDNLSFYTDPEKQDVAMGEQNIYTDFILVGDKPLTYQVRLVDDETSTLSQKINKEWIVQDTIISDTGLWEWREGWPLVSPFKVTDFNKDGYQDLVYYEVGGGHNAITTLVCINNPKSGRLVKLYNPADGTCLWDDPQYDAKSKTISTSTSGGLHGIHTNTTYKLKKGTATPLTKTEIDHTDDTVGVEKVYQFKKGGWKLIKTSKQ